MKSLLGIGKVAGDSPVIILKWISLKFTLMSGWRIGYIAFNNSSQLRLTIREEHLPKLGQSSYIYKPTQFNMLL